jgi:hypothetical protein
LLRLRLGRKKGSGGGEFVGCFFGGGEENCRSSSWCGCACTQFVLLSERVWGEEEGGVSGYIQL